MADRAAVMVQAGGGWAIAGLDEAHRLEPFDCGDEVRNGWLHGRARASQENGDARCYVAADAAARVLGFYAIATGAVLRGGLPGALRRNAPDPVSCVLLAQLGVDVSCQGLGIGRALVLHAMGQAAKIAALAGCRLLVLHPAPPERVGYYRRFGFVEIEATPVVMAMSMKQVRGLLAAVKA